MDCFLMISDRTIHKNERVRIMEKYIKSKRHYQALLYALEQIKKSELSQFIEKIYLYGSCARGEEEWDSDIDLLVQLREEARKYPETKKQILLLKGEVSTDEIADPEANVRFVFGSEWENSSMLYYANVRRDGINLWQ